jgi:2-(1,2-epoxy-1,2-dihydrophenyl)acetyl-CoA isomerase
MEGDAVVVEEDGVVVTVTLHRPERKNALDRPAVAMLHDGLAALASRPSVRVVILTGSGSAFCAGGDVGGLATAGPSGSLDADELRRLMDVSALLHTMPAITIAAVNGACAGAGLGFAAACDLRYAARSATFVPAFLRVGVPGDHGAIWSVTRAVGPARARSLFLLGYPIGAEEALAAGLVHEVVPDDALGRRVAVVAERLAATAPSALRAMKANLNDALVLPFDRYLDVEATRFAEVCGSPDAVEAARAFLEKRPPVFDGP